MSLPVLGLALLIGIPAGVYLGTFAYFLVETW